MDNQKTAVEVLYETMQVKLNNQMSQSFKDMFTMALEIEKKQIIEAATFGLRQEFYDGTEELAEQYYTTKFGKQ